MSSNPPLAMKLSWMNLGQSFYQSTITSGSGNKVVSQSQLQLMDQYSVKLKKKSRLCVCRKILGRKKNSIVIKGLDLDQGDSILPN